MALPGELAEAPARGRMSGRLAALRAVLGRVGAMVPGAEESAGQPEQKDAAAGPSAGGGSRLEQQLARAKEAAAQIRQRQAMQRDAAAAQAGGAAGSEWPGCRWRNTAGAAAGTGERGGSADPAAAGGKAGAAARQEEAARTAEPGAGAAATRLEQQVARGREIAAELRQRRTVQRDATARAPAQQAETPQQTTRLAQQLAIARRVAARLRQRSRERGHGLEL